MRRNLLSIYSNTLQFWAKKGLLYTLLTELETEN